MTPDQASVRLALMVRRVAVLERLGPSPELLGAVALAEAFYREQVRLLKAWSVG